MAQRLEVSGTKLRLSGNYGTHLMPLMAALDRTSGAVLELGMGTFSTPFLHYFCLRHRRKLVSYETDAGWARLFTDQEASYRGQYHDIRVVESWDDADLSGFWDVALVDHSPLERRVTEIKRLANQARFIIIHDSDPKWDNHRDGTGSHYSTIYPLFAHRTDWTGDYRWATALSNFHDLGDFWK